MSQNRHFDDVEIMSQNRHFDNVEIMSQNRHLDNVVIMSQNRHFHSVEIMSQNRHLDNMEIMSHNLACNQSYYIPRLIVPVYTDQPCNILYIITSSYVQHNNIIYNYIYTAEITDTKMIIRAMIRPVFHDDKTTSW